MNRLLRSLEARDPGTYRHSRRTARFAVALARDLGMDRKKVERICVAGLLHDVGKVGIPDAILHKPGLLTPEEWAVMCGHSGIGAAMVERAGLAEIATWILHLHERFDGLGYPDGISGRDIPRESRLLHAADTLEAMTSPRPYRNAALVEDALDALEEGAGSQLDPLFAQRLAALVRSGDLRVADEETIYVGRVTPMTPLTAGASLATV
jgi:putative nucleotidyltransferase with HDIG domain